MGRAAGIGAADRSPDQIVETLLPFVEHGYYHVVVGFPSPYDQETMERLIGEVQPKLAAALEERAAKGQAVTA